MLLRCEDETEFGTGFGSPGGELLVTLDTQLRGLVDTADTDRESVLQFERVSVSVAILDTIII